MTAVESTVAGVTVEKPDFKCAVECQVTVPSLEKPNFSDSAVAEAPALRSLSLQYGHTFQACCAQSYVSQEDMAASFYTAAPPPGTSFRVDASDSDEGRALNETLDQLDLAAIVAEAQHRANCWIGSPESGRRRGIEFLIESLACTPNQLVAAITAFFNTGKEDGNSGVGLICRDNTLIMLSTPAALERGRPSFLGACTPAYTHTSSSHLELTYSQARSQP